MSRPGPGRLELVRDLLNTISVDRGTDELADPAGYRQWLTRSGFEYRRSGPEDEATAAGRHRATVVRDGLRALVATHTATTPPDPAELDRIRADLGHPALRVGVDGDGVVQLVPATDEPGTVALGTLLGIVADASAAGTWRRLKLCHRPTCRWAFYDASPGRVAIWCTMQVCGARHKAREYRSRKATPTQPT